tara:strand:- start:24 stop:437 length:414 start_codon:yes stop_codon:yes gene_type:complete
MEYTQAYNLSTASNPTEVLYIGKHCRIDNLFLFCNKNATITMYVKEYLTTKDANRNRRTNTYYIYKDQKVYAGIQYNKFLTEYDFANRKWIPATHYPEIEFKFPNEFRLYITCETTNGEVDILCNITNLDNYKKRKI